MPSQEQNLLQISSSLKEINKSTASTAQVVKGLLKFQMSQGRKPYEEARDKIKDKEKKTPQGKTDASGMLKAFGKQMEAALKGLKGIDWKKWLSGFALAAIFKEEIMKGLSTLFETMKEKVSTYWTSTFMPAVENLVKDLFGEDFKKFFFGDEEEKAGIIKAWDKVKESLGTAKTNVDGWFKEKFNVTPIQSSMNALQSTWDNTTTAFSNFGKALGITDEKGNLTPKASEIIGYGGIGVTLFAIFKPLTTLKALIGTAKLALTVGKLPFATLKWGLSGVTSIGGLLLKLGAGVATFLALMAKGGAEDVAKLGAKGATTGAKLAASGAKPLG